MAGTSAAIRRSTTMPSIRPLAGLVVVEIGHSIAAPYAGMVTLRRL
jgi:crotonobetainyl-CoA:carnitine CoA-transferase CaiB-like acyl-CoA transferase